MQTVQLFLLLVSSLILALPVAAKSVIAQGQAVITDGDIHQARARAYQEALRQAAMTTGVQVHADTRVDSSGYMTDSLQVRTSQQVESAQIIREVVAGDMLTLTIEAQIISENDACNFPAANYRKKIAATSFILLHPEHLGINDYYGFESGVPTYLLNQLYHSGNFLTRQIIYTVLYDDPLQAPTINTVTLTNESLLADLAREKKIQYLIAGVIRDLSFDLEADRYQKLPRYLPSLSSFLGQQRRAGKRNLLIDIYLYDTLSGELLSRHSYSRSVEDYYAIPEQSKAFGTQQFFQTAYGKLFKQVLDREVASIQHTLSCRPFSMRVIDQKDGKLYLDAGTPERVKAGDILTIYRPDIPGELFNVKGEMDQFGHPKTTLRIEKVFPAYSIGIPDSGHYSQYDIDNGYLLAW